MEWNFPHLHPAAAVLLFLETSTAILSVGASDMLRKVKARACGLPVPAGCWTCGLNDRKLLILHFSLGFSVISRVPLKLIFFFWQFTSGCFIKIIWFNIRILVCNNNTVTLSCKLECWRCIALEIRPHRATYSVCMIHDSWAGWRDIPCRPSDHNLSPLLLLMI